MVWKWRHQQPTLFSTVWPWLTAGAIALVGGLSVALLVGQRYGLRPFRYRRQRLTTVMVRVPRGFVDQVLWPEFVELNGALTAYLTR